MRFSFFEFKKFHGRPVSIFAESKAPPPSCSIAVMVQAKAFA
jgi:hypothetical protein